MWLNKVRDDYLDQELRVHSWGRNIPRLIQILDEVLLLACV